MTLPRQLFFVLVASVALVARARADSTVPVVVTPIPSQTVGMNGTVQNFDLTPYFKNPEATGSAVRMTVFVGTFGSGNIDLALYDTLTPKTVANFLAYVNSGGYTNTFIHRAPPSFVIQGGGFDLVPNANNTGYNVNLVQSLGNIPNEFVGSGLSNIPGTIAMAQSGGDPNSANSEWFINTVDNSASLDPQDFTVFGKIVGDSGLQIAQFINSPSCGPYDWSNFTPAFNQIPLSANSLDVGNLVITQFATIPTITYSATSANTSLVTVSMTGNTLQLTPGANVTGTTNVTITATALDASQMQTNVTVVVAETYTNWKALYNFGSGNNTEEGNPTGDGVPNLSKFAFGGDPLHASPRAPGLPQINGNGTVTFYQKQLAALSYQVYESFDLSNWTLIWQTSNGYSNSAVVAHPAGTGAAAGFDIVTIQDPAGGSPPLRFWKVVVARTL
ncbi:MAG TPA: peptidylprolyl isomerase [Opitutales bacterium]|jgi:cyclophilin family peptidyl-prolyl cis-trans isomerase|nr:peptidylprolyl isomerase [Opitutales bacterium]